MLNQPLVRLVVRVPIDSQRVPIEYLQWNGFDEAFCRARILTQYGSCV